MALAFSQEEVARIRQEMRQSTLREAAFVADEMAEELMDDAETQGPFTKTWVAAHYKLIAKLIRRLELDEHE